MAVFDLIFCNYCHFIKTNKHYAHTLTYFQIFYLFDDYILKYKSYFSLRYVYVGLMCTISSMLVFIKVFR